MLWRQGLRAWTHGEGNARDLQAEGGVTLLEHEVPDVQGPVHLGSEENCRPYWAPGAVGEVGHVVPVGSHQSGTTVAGRDGVGAEPPLCSPSTPCSLQGKKFFLMAEFWPHPPGLLQVSAQRLHFKGLQGGLSCGLATALPPQLTPGNGPLSPVRSGPSAPVVRLLEKSQRRVCPEKFILLRFGEHYTSHLA